MIELSPPAPGLLFFGILYRSDLFEEPYFFERVERLFGKTIIFKPTYNPLSSYYSKEMGEENQLKRLFFVTTATFPREFLLSQKLLAIEWEKEWSRENKRMVNVDVGFLSPENFILATTKNYSHRIFLGQKIFADLTYQYQEGSFQQLPWTYPDFNDPLKLEFFNWCRSYLLTRSKIETL